MFDRSDDVADVLSFHDFQVRGTVNDLLGADLSPKLYPALFNQITASLSTCFSSAGEVYHHIIGYEITKRVQNQRA